jgi:hypothetical protein
VSGQLCVCDVIRNVYVVVSAVHAVMSPVLGSVREQVCRFVHMFRVLCFNKNLALTALPLLFHIIIAIDEVRVFIILWLSSVDSSVTLQYFYLTIIFQFAGTKILHQRRKHDNRSATHFPGKIAPRVR